MIGAELEAARPPAGPAFADAVTFAFGDPAAELHGLARLGLSGAGAERVGSALMVLFAGREPVAAVARGGVPVDADAGFERLALPGLATTVQEPLRGWTVAAEGAFALAFEALGPAAWWATSSCAGCAARCARAGASGRSAASASAGTPGASRTGSGWRPCGR